MATLEAQFNDKHNCQKCIKKYPLELSDGRENTRAIAKRKSKGCFNFTTRTYLLDNIKYKSCIGNYTLQGIAYYYELYFNYEKGILPFKGDLGIQPNKMVEVLHIIDTIRKDKLKEG